MKARIQGSYDGKKVRSVEDSKSEVKDVTASVELYSHEKRMGGAPSPCYSSHGPLPTQPLLSSALLLVQNAQKRHT